MDGLAAPCPDKLDRGLLARCVGPGYARDVDGVANPGIPSDLYGVLNNFLDFPRNP